MIDGGDRQKFVDILKSELEHLHRIEFPCGSSLFAKYSDEKFKMLFKLKNISIKHPEPVEFAPESYHFKDMSSIHTIKSVDGDKPFFVGGIAVKNNIEIGRWLSDSAYNFMRMYVCTNLYVVASFNKILVAMGGSLEKVIDGTFSQIYIAVKEYVYRENKNYEDSAFANKSRVRNVLAEEDRPIFTVQNIKFLVITCILSVCVFFFQYFLY